MCIIYTCRYKCNCVTPDVSQALIHCPALLRGKPCNAVKGVSYLSSDCDVGCSGWQVSASNYREEYRREVADNHLYYGNKDTSQEEIYFEGGDLSSRRPRFVLPSYESGNPARKNAPRGLEVRSAMEEKVSLPFTANIPDTLDTPGTPKSEDSVYSSNSSASLATPSTVESVGTGEDNMKEGIHQKVWKTTKPAGQGVKKRWDCKGGRNKKL